MIVTDNIPMIAQTFKVQREHFEDIAAGRKTVEGRPVHKVTAAEGDRVQFTCGDDTVCARIVKLHPASSFAELYLQHGHSLLPRVNTQPAAVETYRQYYTASDEAGGVVGIEFTLDV